MADEFNPDEYLAQVAPTPGPAPSFDPDAYLSAVAPSPQPTPTPAIPQPESTLHHLLFSPDVAENLRGTIQDVVKSVPSMALQTLQAGYEGAKFAALPQERTRIATEALKQGVDMGVQTAQDIQAPIGSREWMRGGVGLGMMAAPAIGGLAEALFPKRLTAAPLSETLFPKEAPPIQAPITEPIAPVATEQAAEQPIGEPNASEITSTASVPVQPLREEMGGEAPLRQQGETPGALPIERGPGEVGNEPVAHQNAPQVLEGDVAKSSDQKFNTETLKWEPKTERDYVFDAQDLRANIANSLSRLGVDVKNTDLPQLDQFSSGRDYYHAMREAESKMRSSGAKVAGFVLNPEGTLQKASEISKPTTEPTSESPLVQQVNEGLTAAEKSPTLRAGEKGTGDLFQGQDQPFNLAGETGVYTEALQKKADADAAAKAEAQTAADKAQNILPFESEADQLERMKAEHEQGLLSDVEEHQGRGGDELVDVLKQHGLPLISKAEHYTGELNNVREMFASTGSKTGRRGFGNVVTGTGEKLGYRDIFRTGGGDLDSLTATLKSKGFDVETPSDALNLIQDRLRTGKKVFGSEARAEEPLMFGGPGTPGQSEFDTMGRKPIRIANADIDAERAARGAPPLMSEARKANPVLWDDTMAQLDRTPQSGKILVDNINSGEVKTTNRIQQTMLLHEEISLRNEKAMEAERAVDPHASEEAKTEARANFSALEARIDATERAARKAGSIAGSALQARQIAAYDDFTYAALETKFRNAKGGPLTETESAKIKAQADEIASLKTDLAKAQDEGARQKAMETLSNLIKENVKSAKAEVKSGKTVIDILHAQRDAAKARIIARRGRLNVGIDPTALLDEAIIGASHIADGFVKFTDWSEKMVKDFGERIKPYLADLFTRSQEYHDAHAKMAKDVRPKLSPVERVAEAAKDRTPEGGLTNKMVFDLAREHVRDGVEGLDEVMSAVQKDLEPHFPGLTERQVRDMFSDYGKVKFPSKAADLVALRDYRRQGQLVSALEDAQEGLSPKRSGAQRDKPTARVIELQKQVQDAMRENGITTAGDPTRLKTNLDRYKTILDTRIADAERRLKEADYAKPTRSATVLDPEAVRKQSLLNQKTEQINKEIERQRLANRTGLEKFQDGAVKWARVAKLASPRVFPKLVEAGLIRVITNPISRALSQPLRLIPGLTRKAPAQLRVGLKAEASRVASILTSGPEALRKLVGKSKLDALGKKRLLDNEMFNFVGNAHGAVKEPVRQGEYSAAVKYYTDQALADGLDIREPAVQSTIVSSAVADANWQIFMGENPFSKYFVSLVVNGLKNGKFTGARTLANAVQFVMPIVKVSSNIAIHTARLGVGLPESMIRLGTALKRGGLANGAEKLSHEDAQAITRSFSAGALGVVLASYAWNNPQYFGGVYDENAPKNKQGLKTNEIKTPFGVLPGWINHAPEMQWLNTVASARRVYDKYYAKGTGTANSLTEALAFSLMAPVKNLPMIDTWLRYFSSRQSAGQTFGSTIRDAVVPGGKSTLGIFDQKERSPQTFLQEIEMGIPGLRQTVPTRTAHGTSTRKQPLAVQ